MTWGMTYNSNSIIVDMGLLVKLVLEFGTVGEVEVSNALSLEEEELAWIIRTARPVQRRLQGGELCKGYCQPC